MSHFSDIGEAGVAFHLSSVRGNSNYNNSTPALFHMKDLTLKVLSELIQAYLDENNESIRAFAKDCDVSHQTISSIVSEKANPSLDTILKILDKTGCEAKLFKSW